MTPDNVAGEQVLRGAPGRAARPWLLMVSIVAAVLFAVNTLLVFNHLTTDATVKPDEGMALVGNASAQRGVREVHVEGQHCSDVQRWRRRSGRG